MPAPDPFLIARRQMIEGQLWPANVQDARVIAAMAGVQRELFVPEALKGAAYVDEGAPVSRNRYLLAPVLLARLLEELQVRPADRVLDIGCATGYSTVVLARLSAHVTAVEEQMELAERARQLLAVHKTKNAEVVTGPMVPGYPSAGPYDIILINGAVDALPQALADQLAEGGRMALVQRDAAHPASVSGLGRAMLYTRQGGRLLSRVCFDASAPLLHGFETREDFVF